MNNLKPHTIPKQNKAETSLYAAFPTLICNATSAVYRENRDENIKDGPSDKIDHVG